MLIQVLLRIVYYYCIALLILFKSFYAFFTFVKMYIMMYIIIMLCTLIDKCVKTSYNLVRALLIYVNGSEILGYTSIHKGALGDLAYWLH